MSERRRRLKTKIAVMLALSLAMVVFVVTGACAMGQSVAVSKTSESLRHSERPPGVSGGGLGLLGERMALRFGGTGTASRGIEGAYQEFRKEHPELSPALNYESSSSDRGLQELCVGRAEVAVIRRALDQRERLEVAKAFPDVRLQPEEVELGRYAVVMVVHGSNGVASLGYGQIEDIYRGKTANWSEVGGRNMPIERRGTRGGLLSYGMVLDQILRGKHIELGSLPSRGGPDSVTMEQYDRMVRELLKKYPGGLPFTSFQKDEDVFGDVARTPGAIGYAIFPSSGRLPPGVRAIALVAPEGGEPVSPTAENVLIGKYPLQCKIRLLIHPSASDLCRKFVTYACSGNAAGFLRDVGLFPASDGRAMLIQQRLLQFKAGKGQRVSAVGVQEGRAAMTDVVMEYVKAKAVVQMGYAATDSDVAAVGAFARAGSGATSKPAQAGGSAAIMAGSAIPSVGTPSSAPATMPATAPALVPPMTPFVAAGGKELLFLADKPSARAMELHGQKWNALGSTSLTTSGRDPASPNDGYAAASKPGQPNGTGPAEYLLAGRAVAVIVNPANKIDALTIGQLQAIFGGEVEDWGTLGYSKSQVDGSQIGGSQITGSQIKGSQIKAIGLRGDDLATGIFEKECLDRYKWRRVAVKKDTAEALAAVSMDPQAIGFVDLTGIPATGQSVKILAIKLGSGAPPPALGATSPRGGGVYYPSPENIKSAMYPLSQRLWLYVHPKASDTAKDFVKFIATCGASEASPYADTVKAVMDTYRKHGLVPLADAALERMAKDAMADAAAKAKAESAKPKGKGKGKK